MTKLQSAQTINNPLKNSALIVIDIQRGLFNKSIPIFQEDKFLSNVNYLIDKAHASNVPIIFIQHSNDTILIYGSNDWQFHPDLHLTDGDELIHKIHGNAFEETRLGDYLQSKQVNQLVITGLVTHGCVKSTTIGALDLGYEVVLTQDGHSNYSKDAENIITEWNKKLASSGAEVKPTKEIDFSVRIN